MTSIKVKFRPSMVDGKEGGLYFQIIHNRVVRQLNTDYKVFAEDWDAESESVIVNGSLQSPVGYSRTSGMGRGSSGKGGPLVGNGTSSLHSRRCDHHVP